MLSVAGVCFASCVGSVRMYACDAMGKFHRKSFSNCHTFSQPQLSFLSFHHAICVYVCLKGDGGCKATSKTFFYFPFFALNFKNILLRGGGEEDIAGSVWVKSRKNVTNKAFNCVSV